MTGIGRCKLCLARLGIDGCPRCLKLTPEELQHRRLIVAGADRARRPRGEVTRHPSRPSEPSII